MPIFSYAAKNKSGRVVRGQAEADNENALARQLHMAGLWLLQAAADTGRNNDVARDSATKVDTILLRRQAQARLAAEWQQEPNPDGLLRLIQTPEARRDPSGCLLPFAVLWNAGVILAIAAHFGILPIQVEGAWGVWGLLFLSPFVLIGLFFLQGALWTIFGHEEWRISHNRLEMLRRWQFLKQSKVQCFINSSLEVKRHKDGDGVVYWDLLVALGRSADLSQKRLLFRASDCYSQLAALHILGTLIANHTGWRFSPPDNYWSTALNDVVDLQQGPEADAKVTNSTND